MKTEITPLQSFGCEITLDGLEEHYHVRACDNRVRLVLSKPGWACNTGHDYWYASRERSVDGNWTYDGILINGGVTKHQGLEAVRKEYVRLSTEAGQVK